jgi:phage-related tail fiber protein
MKKLLLIIFAVLSINGIAQTNTDLSANDNHVPKGQVISISRNGNVGIDVANPTAALHIKAGTLGTAPLKLTAGTNLKTPEAGALEYDGSHLYFTAINGGTRSQLDQQNNLLTSSQVAKALGYVPLAGNQTITVSGDATGSGATTIALTLANSGVAPGTYNNVTVDAKGRVLTGSNASYLTINNGNIEVPQTAKVGTLNCEGDAKIGGTLNLTGNIQVGEKVSAKEVSTNNLSVAGNASANKYIVLKGTADQFLKADGSLDNSQYLTGINGALVASALGYTPLAGNQTVTVSGDATGSGATAIALTLANSGVAAGTYNNVTVDTKGRVLTGSNTNYLTGITTEQVQGALGYSPLAGNQTVTVSGDATGSGATAITLTLANSGVAAGTYNNVTVDAKGRVLTGSNTSYLTGITTEQVQGALGYSPLAGNQTVTVSGDATGSGATAISLTLANSGVEAGTYNNVTVDAKGRVLTGSTTNYLTGITAEQVQGALGYTPYNSSNPSKFITSSDLSGYLPIAGGNITGSFLVQGNMGIGTTNPDQKLTVKGKIHAEEIIVDLAVPADYVFKPNYKLMPLKQVEQFVKTNSHLPEIPSAGEITKNGLNIGEMQNKLLQKVEELTLYMIGQQKTIDQQQAQIKELNNKLSKLNKQ